MLSWAWNQTLVIIWSISLPPTFKVKHLRLRGVVAELERDFGFYMPASPELNPRL